MSTETPFEFPLDDEQVRRRIKAARLMAGLSVSAVGNRLGAGMGTKTLRRIESGERKINSERELKAIAEATEHELQFFVSGDTMAYDMLVRDNERRQETPEVDHDLGRIEDRMDILESKLDALIKATAPQRLRSLFAGVLDEHLSQRDEAARHPAPEGVLGQHAEGSGPSDQGHREGRSDRDTGAQPGTG